MAVSAISTWIDAADRLIWPEQTGVDNATLAHYFYSPYPNGLNKEEIAQWCRLQSEVLAPFSPSYHYAYQSNKGLHLWFAKSAFKGIPETASHSALATGKHRLKSENFEYIEQWQDGIMQSCIAMKAKATDDKHSQPLASVHHGWACERKLKSTVVTPAFWAGLSTMVFGAVMLFILASYVATSSQLAILESKSEELSEQVGPKLSEQTSLAGYVNSVNTIRRLQTNTRFLPESLSLALSALPQQSEQVSIESITWQNNQMNIAIKSDELNITELIENAESIGALQSANIRPQGNENTWVFEVQF